MIPKLLLSDRSACKNLLPKLELSDVPNVSNYPKPKKLSTFGYSPVFYEEATNGLTYNNISRSLDLNSTNEIKT